MNPKLEARAFCLWRYCEAHGWENVTWAEAQEALGVTRDHLYHVLIRKGWLGRLQGCKASYRQNGRKGAARTGKKLGRRFDENVLDLVELMGA